MIAAVLWIQIFVTPKRYSHFLNPQVEGACRVVLCITSSISSGCQCITLGEKLWPSFTGPPPGNRWLLLLLKGPF